MENETNNQNEVKTEKKSNKTLIIILSVVGGVLLLGGIIFAVLINTIFKTATGIIDDAKNQIDNGSEVANKIIEEAKEKQKEILGEGTLFAYNEGNIQIQITGTLENQKLYVNDNEITEYDGYNYDSHSVTKVGSYYVLITKYEEWGVQVSMDKAYVFNDSGKLIGTLPIGTSKYQAVEIVTVENYIFVTVYDGVTVVHCNGDVKETFNYYTISDDQIKLDHTDNTYYEIDDSELDHCN